MIEIKVLASGSTGNCYWISDGRTPLLLEAGLPLQKIREGTGFQVSNLAGCLISHEHGDHSRGIPELVKAGVNCFMSQGTAEALGMQSHRIKILEAKKNYHIGTWQVMPFEVQHDAVEPFGYLLRSIATKEKLVYITDSSYSRYIFNGLSYIMVECNYSMEILNENIQAGRVPATQKKRILQSHFNLENVKDFLQANDLSQVKEIWLLHLSDRNSDAELFKREIMELTGKPVYIAEE